MNRPLDLITCPHRHFTIDLPGWGKVVSDLRITAGMVIAYLVGSFNSFTPWPWVIMASFVLLVLGVRVILRKRGVLSTPAKTESSLVEQSLDGKRLVCYGDPKELDRLKELKSEFFEPVLISFARASLNVTEWVMIGAGLIVLVVASFYLGFSRLIVLGLFLVTCGAISMARFVFPNYYRIVPGRLDILRYGFWRSKLKHKDSIWLASALIVCRFDQRTLEITPMSNGGHGKVEYEHHGKEPDQRLKIHLSNVSRPHEFAKAVFRAAICIHPTPPLPDDELLG